MERRSLLSCGSVLMASSIAGCLNGRFSSDNQSKASRAHFKEMEGGYIVSIQNELDSSVNAEVSVIDAAKTTKEKNVSLGSGETTNIKNLLTTNSEPYTLKMSVSEHKVKRTLQPSEDPYDKFSLIINSDGITFEERYRPVADVAISNHLNEQVEVRVTIRGPNSPVYDILTVPSDEVMTFKNVFSEEAKYKVSVRDNSMEKSTTFRNSDTSGISIVVNNDGLLVDSVDR